MKNYVLYMNRQQIPPELHDKLLALGAAPRAARRERPWVRWGALAACCALVLGAGMWGLSSGGRPGSNPGQPAPGAVSRPEEAQRPELPAPDAQPLQPLEDKFVVHSPAEGGMLAFPGIPGIDYRDPAGHLMLDCARAYDPGAFSVPLEKEDIQSIFWGPEGGPEGEHPKAEQGDLPWMLFWDGYALTGTAWYSGQGQLTELVIWGEKDLASFQLELRVGGLPFTCCILLDRGEETSDVFGVPVTGWRQVYDRDGDGITDYVCSSEFMAGEVGVRFENRNSPMRSEYGGNTDLELGGAEQFNALFVRQALTGGLHLDRLAEREEVPAWREERFDTLEQARAEEAFAPYLPAAEPEGYGSGSGSAEFHGSLSYQEGVRNRLFVRWSRGYDSVEVCVYLQGLGKNCALADPARPETYDLRLYSIPWCDSVPEEYRETVDCPAFRAEDMSPELVEARGQEKDTGGLSFRFDVLHPDGTLVSYRCDRMTAGQVWAMVEETLPKA
ncbi:MAG: hypothetical protein HFF39_08125 [Lawsonibacter sp.]|nr:hypothetical protein [Lawsonibacter sp.]